MQNVIIVGNKETYLTKIVMKKIHDAGIFCDFISWNINDINAKWKDTRLVILYMDGRGRPSDDVLHFLADKMIDAGCMLIPTGDEENISYISELVPKGLIYQKFYRPVNNEELLQAITELFLRAETGMLKKSILVIDDDLGYLSLVREWLKDTYRVGMANSGTLGVRYLERNQVDLILLDYEMPEMSGPEVFEKIRGSEKTSAVPVMFLTGKDDKDSVMSVLALKPDGYFLKSIEKNELLQRLREFFMNRENPS